MHWMSVTKTQFTYVRGRKLSFRQIETFTVNGHVVQAKDQGATNEKDAEFCR